MILGSQKKKKISSWSLHLVKSEQKDTCIQHIFPEPKFTSQNTWTGWLLTHILKHKPLREEYEPILPLGLRGDHREFTFLEAAWSAGCTCIYFWLHSVSLLQDLNLSFLNQEPVPNVCLPLHLERKEWEARTWSSNSQQSFLVLSQQIPTSCL